MQLNIGQRIRELRRRSGCTQEALAGAIGVSSQAVSRWESEGGYPDMETVPLIANYFGVSIDSLFGYNNERALRIDELVARIEKMDLWNNGVNVNVDECISLAREAMIEFPGNEKVMLCLASVLYNAGYVRRGEVHRTDAEGYDVYDTGIHRTYTEWSEAIALYEKLLQTAEPGELRNRAINELSQLYLNVGAHDRAQRLAETAPNIQGSREFLKMRAADGKARVVACGEALIKTAGALSGLMVQTVLGSKKNMTPAEKVQSLRGAADVIGLVCPDGNCGSWHDYLSQLNMLISLYLWLDGQKDAAFEALYTALRHFDRLCVYLDGNAGYTAPLVRLVYQAPTGRGECPRPKRCDLLNDWPGWCVPEAEHVKAEMQADHRWDAWVAELEKLGIG
ncbi:MAG: helix-turn-helix transcriptional regulator [Clostridia bacterium]|nr:helix-turn-helix transcriptional regulator [Clostridia bacterium]